MSLFFIPEPTTIIPDLKETARYLGYKKTDIPEKNVSELIEKAAAEMGKIITPQAVYSEFDLTITNEENISFANISFASKDLARNLKNCQKVILLAATLGPKVDRLIRTTQLSDSVYAAVLQATGAMFAEVFVDKLNEQIKEEAATQGLSCKPRFSPGYGDLSLQVQTTFFNLLPCSRIGLSLMNTLIMAPEKSVTAFIGLYS